MQSNSPHNPSAYHILHQPHLSRFSLILHDDSNPATLEYQLVKRNGRTALNLTHTYVPLNFRGRGIAAKLVRFACAYARHNNFNIIPTCTYIPVYLERNPGDSDLVASDWGFEVLVVCREEVWCHWRGTLLIRFPGFAARFFLVCSFIGVGLNSRWTDWQNSCPMHSAPGWVWRWMAIHTLVLLAYFCIHYINTVFWTRFALKPSSIVDSICSRKIS